VNRLVNEDWQKAESLGVGMKDFVKFDFQFNEINLVSNMLAIQFDNKIDQINDTYNSTPTIGFDDLSHINDLKYNDAEVLEYKAMDPFAIHIYPEIMSSAVYRSGAEEEYPFLGKIGPIGKLKANAEDSIIFIRIPERLLLPPAVASHRILYPKENLRVLRELADVTEVDPEYMLRWEAVEYFTIFRPKIENREQLKHLTHELIASTPGYDSLRYLNKVQIEKSRYWEHKVNLSKDIFKIESIEQQCPEIIYTVEKDDMKSDEESDDDNIADLDLLVLRPNVEHEGRRVRRREGGPAVRGEDEDVLRRGYR
jgi:hypothetical protein